MEFTGSSVAFDTYRNERKHISSRGRTYEGRQTWTSVSVGSTAITYATTHYIVDDVSNISCLFGNWYQSSGGGTDLYVGNVFTITASLEDAVGGNLFPFKFRGASSYTFGTSIENVETDPLTVSIAAGSTVRIRVCVSTTDTNFFHPRNNVSIATGGYTDQRNDTTDVTVSGSVSAATGANYYGPTAVIGKRRQKKFPVIGFIGDSISMGSGDTSNSEAGYLWRAFNGNTIPNLVVPKYSVVNIGHSGATLRDYTQVATYYSYTSGRFKAFDYVDNAICELGINDKTGGATGIKTRAVSLWRRMYQMGIKVWQCTITPFTGSSDSWATATNQTPSGYAVTAIANDGGGKIRLTVTAGGSNPSLPNTYTIEVYDITGGGIPATLTVASVAADQVNCNEAYVGGYALGARPFIGCQQVEDTRTGFNDWVRDGAPMDAAFAPVAVGTTTAGTLRAGMSTHPLAGYFDPTALIEVNAAGTLTVNGGRWPASGTTDGIHPVASVHSSLSAGINLNSFRL